MKEALRARKEAGVGENDEVKPDGFQRTPFLPAIFAMANHHLLRSHRDVLDQLSSIRDAEGGTTQGEAFDLLSKAMHDVLKGELEAEALGPFKSLVREGDPEAPAFWSTSEAHEQLVRLGVKPVEGDAPEAPNITPRDKPPVLEDDAVAAFMRALEDDDD